MAAFGDGAPDATVRVLEHGGEQDGPEDFRGAFFEHGLGPFEAGTSWWTSASARGSSSSSGSGARRAGPCFCSATTRAKSSGCAT